MALEHGNELERQNKALDPMEKDIDEINDRVNQANRRTRRLLGSRSRTHCRLDSLYFLLCRPFMFEFEQKFSLSAKHTFSRVFTSCPSHLGSFGCNTSVPFT
ncbi:unnamed protein product [Rhodiola kirilowii]